MRNVRKNGDWNCPKPTGMAAAFPQSTSNTRQPVRLGEGKAKPPCTCTEIWRHVYTVGQKEPTRSSCVGTWMSSWEGAEQHPKERTHSGLWETHWGHLGKEMVIPAGSAQPSCCALCPERWAILELGFSWNQQLKLQVSGWVSCFHLGSFLHCA